MSSPWHECIDEGSGKIYYYNSQSGDSQWHRPDDYAYVRQVLFHSVGRRSVVSLFLSLRVVRPSPPPPAEVSLVVVAAPIIAAPAVVEPPSNAVMMYDATSHPVPSGWYELMRNGLAIAPLISV
jgi:hypothetical protein